MGMKEYRLLKRNMKAIAKIEQKEIPSIEEKISTLEISLKKRIQRRDLALKSLTKKQNADTAENKSDALEQISDIENQIKELEGKLSEIEKKANSDYNKILIAAKKYCYPGTPSKPWWEDIVEGLAIFWIFCATFVGFMLFMYNDMSGFNYTILGDPNIDCFANLILSIIVFSGANRFRTKREAVFNWRAKKWEEYEKMAQGMNYSIDRMPKMHGASALQSNGVSFAIRRHRGSDWRIRDEIKSLGGKIIAYQKIVDYDWTASISKDEIHLGKMEKSVENCENDIIVAQSQIEDLNKKIGDLYSEVAPMIPFANMLPEEAISQ
jgi:archaellum component FlaC